MPNNLLFVDARATTVVLIVVASKNTRLLPDLRNSTLLLFPRFTYLVATNI